MRREAQLKPEFADQYPSLEPGRWYTAAAIAGLVRGMLIVYGGAEAEAAERTLDEGHFAFRGGEPRHGSWLGLRTRYLDRHATAAAS